MQGREGRMMLTRAQVEEWIAGRVEPVTESGCWLWIGNCNSKGYGRIQVNKKRIGAHRFIYELLRGPIPSGLQCDHLCRVPCCVNPDHIQLVTSRENTLRGETLPALNSKKTHCKRGHAFTPENTLVLSTTKHRLCRICYRARLKRYREEKKPWTRWIPRKLRS